MANTQKQAIVDQLLEKFGQTTNFALVRFEKTSHKALEELRNTLKKNNASLNVIKNSLFEKAINKVSSDNRSFKDLRDKAFPIKEKSAILFLREDASAGLKVLNDFAKKNDSVGFKVGIIDNVVYDAKSLERIAGLPGKDQLIAKIIGSFKSPMARTTRAMKNDMQKLVYILSQKSQQG